MYTFQHARGTNRKNKIIYEIKLEKEEIGPSSFYEINVILLPKLDKDIMKKKMMDLHPYEYRCYNPQQNTKINPAMYF